MAIANELRHVQRQEQKMTVSLIQGLNMLSLPAQEIYGYLVELAMSNPMLNIPEPPERGFVQFFGNGDSTLSFEPVPRYSAPASDTSGVYRDEDDEFDPFYKSGVDFEGNSLLGSLRLQLSMCRLSPVENLIGEEILGDLDDNGYFTGNLNTICLLYYQPLSVGQKVLSVIQGFYPRGIAAHDLREALCLQVSDSFEYAELAKKIINSNLSAVCDSSSALCAKKYGVSKKVIEQVFDYIRTLEPRPGSVESPLSAINYTVPDIVVKQDDGEIKIYISKETELPLSISSEYLELLHSPGLAPDDKLYLRTRLNEARSLIHSVEVRHQTIYRMAFSLISMQSDFFRFGPEKLEPMTMKELADSMGVNVSTVSRLVQDKYISTQWGMFPLKYFFTTAIRAGDDSTVSAATVKQKIEALISTEKPESPFKDEQICEILNRSGYELSRRTVTKYRQLLGIPGYGKRRLKGVH